MIIKKLEDTEKWLEERKGKITGTKLKDIIVKRGTGQKIGFFKLIAERIAIPADDENPMERGIRLEEEALERFEKETGKKLIKELVMWQREDTEEIAYSPDGYTENLKEVADAKCPNSENFLKAYITQDWSDYEDQVLQAFCVNEELETFYLIFYDPRLPLDFFYFTIKRDKEKVEKYLDYQKEVLKEVEEWIKKLTF